MPSIEYDPDYLSFISRRREQILARVEHAAQAVGRDPRDITVMAVSKTVDVDKVAAARSAGYDAFGENRPQELERKLALLNDDPAFADIRFHMIGNLQANKINHVLACKPALIHSIASPELAAAVSKRAEARGMVQPVLFEVNVSGELSKSGMSPDEIRASFDELCSLKGIQPRGLMTMAPRNDPEVARTTFGGLRELLCELASRAPADVAPRFTELSMGMSDDFEEGIRQGATIIRLGRVVFDPGYEFEPLAG
jgi:pyridoxal phosphate enzyme (YggS family)